MTNVAERWHQPVVTKPTLVPTTIAVAIVSLAGVREKAATVVDRDVVNVGLVAASPERRSGIRPEPEADRKSGKSFAEHQVSVREKNSLQFFPRVSTKVFES